jgi:hypothetical protein
LNVQAFQLVYQGKSRLIGEAEMLKILKNPVGKNTDLTHSERLFIEVYKKSDFLSCIGKILAKHLL